MNGDLSRLNELGGWEGRPETVARIVGDKPSFWAAHPELKDCHKGKTVLLFKAFDSVLGKQPSYRPQWRGTCVGRGGRIIELLQAMQDAVGLGKFKALNCAAGTYGGARVEIGYGVHGGRITGDGASVAYAVECMSTLGSVLCEQYETGKKLWDLRKSSDDDDLAVQWGASGIPDDLEPLIARYKVRDWWPVNEGAEAQDAIASGRPVIFGTSLCQWDRGSITHRDRNGMARIIGTTAHCWLADGTIDDGKVDAVVEDNKSWGDDCVDGPDPYNVGAGRYLAYPDDFTRQLQSTYGRQRFGEGYALEFFEGLEAQQKLLDWITL